MRPQTTLPRVGDRFGRLELTGKYRTVPEDAAPTHHKLRCECICDCGQTGFYSWHHMLTGHTLSCGCIRREKARERQKLLKPPKLTPEQKLQRLLTYPGRRPLPVAGDRFGSLAFTGKFALGWRTNDHELTCECLCDCGTLPKFHSLYDLRDGGVTSCGCRRSSDSSWEERFWRSIEKTDNCWIWIGPRSNRDYGVFWKGPHCQLAHRVSWEMHYGPIPAGSMLLHSCDNRPCVRPDHLTPGTGRENSTDMWQKRNAAIASLTALQRDDIRTRYADFTSQLCTEFGISQLCIRDIVYGTHDRKWRNQFITT